MDKKKEFEKMAVALFIGFKALLLDETPVACVLVSEKTDRIVSMGHNDTNRSMNGTRHAELMAIDRILEAMIPTERRGDMSYIESIFSELTLYVMVEPCIMCASAIKQLGVKKVVYGCPNDRFGGNGTVLSIHQDHINRDYQSYGGILRTEAIQLLRNFYIQENLSAPQPKVKKNREIGNKEFPPSINFPKYMDSDTFMAYYGKDRLEKLYHSTSYEVTPYFPYGYKLEDYLSLESLLSTPYIGQMYEPKSLESSITQDLQDFFPLFFDINDFHRVNYSKEVSTIDEISLDRKQLSQKKRRLNEQLNLVSN